MTSATIPPPIGAGLAVCVFCGARRGALPSDVEAADEVGALIGRRGHRLVYGGGGSGLMGVVAWAVYRAGGDITGVVPDFLYEPEGGRNAPPQILRLTRTMGERKREMLECADVFLALPGGYGTLDEVLEVVSLTKLRVMIDKPLVLLETGRAWDNFLSLTADLRQRGYTDGDVDGLFRVAYSPVEALDALEATASRPPPLHVNRTSARQVTARGGRSLPS